jgi:hypothetical protein
MASRMRRMRLARVGVGLAVALSGVGMVAPVAYGEPATGGGPLSKAYQSTVGAKTADMSMSLKEQVHGQAITISAKGAFDWSRSLGHMSMTISAPPSGPERLNEVLAGSDEYVQLPAAARSAVGGKAWIEVSLGSGGSSAETDNPTTMLALLEAGSSGVKKVGSARLDGVDTTVYRAIVDPSQEDQNLPSQLRKSEQQVLSQFAGTTSVPVELWVDGQGRVRQLVEHATLTPKAGSAAASAGPIHMVVTVGLSNYGTPVSVTVPAQSQVSHQPLSQLQGGGSQSS